MIKHIFLIILISAGFSSCAYYSHPPLPETWKISSEISECPVLDGTYYNSGWMHNKNNPSSTTSLFMLLIGDNSKNMNGVEYIKLKQFKNELVIEAYSRTSMLASRSAQFDTSDCKNGFLKISVPKPTGAFASKGEGVPAVGYLWEAFQLTKGVDNSLILRQETKGITMITIWPMVGTNWNWYKFPRK